jgi:septal ring factor EnvC (AmiA/AmiB activator)
MQKPFDGEFEITQIFGVNPQDYAQFGLKGHNGIDYALSNGTKVLAPHGGKIIEATLDPAGYGLYIKIENDIEGSVLAHFKDFRVGVGDTVSEGQLIAFSDNSGNSTGPHLHWGYYRFPRNRQNGYNGFIDQSPYLEDNSQSNALKRCLIQHEDLVKQCNDFKEAEKQYKKTINTQQDEIEQLRKDKNALEKKLDLLQTEKQTDLAKKDLDCQAKLDSLTTRLSKDFELKEDSYKKTILDLETKLKEKQIIKEVKPVYKTGKEKWRAVFNILFS